MVRAGTHARIDRCLGAPHGSGLRTPVRANSRASASTQRGCRSQLESAENVRSAGFDLFAACTAHCSATSSLSKCRHAVLEFVGVAPARMAADYAHRWMME